MESALSDRPRADPVVARRMIAHALNMPALRTSPPTAPVRPAPAPTSPPEPEKESKSGGVGAVAMRIGAKKAARRLLANALGLKPDSEAMEAALPRNANRREDGEGTSGSRSGGVPTVEGAVSAVRHLALETAVWQLREGGASEEGRNSERSGGAGEGEDILSQGTPSSSCSDKGRGLTRKKGLGGVEVGGDSDTRRNGHEDAHEDTRRDVGHREEARGEEADGGKVLIDLKRGGNKEKLLLTPCSPSQNLRLRKEKGKKIETPGRVAGGRDDDVVEGKIEEDKQQRRSLAMGPTRQLLAHALGQSPRRGSGTSKTAMPTP